MSPVDLVIAVPAALLSAASFGLTGAMQHRVARAIPTAESRRFGLLFALVRHPFWLLSLLVNLVGVVGQWVALSTAPLVLVQPLLVSGVLFAIVFAAALQHQRPDRTVIYGGVLCVVGLAAFLLLAQPSGGGETMALHDVLPLSLGLLAILVLCLIGGVRGNPTVRTLAYATAAGVFYGVTAGLIKVAMDTLQDGLVVFLTSWPIYAVAICGPLGFVLNQHAFQAGVALAPALSVIVILDPLVGIGVGILWLGEGLRSGPAIVTGEVLALAAMAVGVAILARRAPQVVREAHEAHQVAESQ
ncbi:DMT family transporter [Fodinicola acaciae]|uniref:DMT family transporter n=1 Tax=Fodinicola acaciae TaxID=2681555 RepID=UPI001C9E59B4|nr:DMT family transporter [Fodinicola acaciae]